MSELPTVSASDTDACCESGCDCAPSSSARRRLAGMSPKVWVYLALLAGLYGSVVAYALGHGAAFWGVLAGGGFEHEAVGEGWVATVSGIWLAAGELLTELMPYWLGGMLLAGALMGLATWQRLAGWLRSGGMRASAMAAGAGSAVPICSCGMAPLLGGMTRAGVPLGPAMAFVIAAPMINVPAVLITAGALGPGLAVGRVIGTLAIALLAAALFGWWAARAGGMGALLRLEEGDGTSHCGASESALAGSGDAQQGSGWRSALGSAGKLFLQMNSYLLLAVVLGGLIRALVPAEWIASWVGGEGPGSVVIASAAASLLYFCSYTEVPTAAALVDLGMGPGATLAYLLVGPGVSLPSLALLSAIFRPKLLLAYVGFAFLCAVLAGIAFNLLPG